MTSSSDRFRRPGGTAIESRERRSRAGTGGALLATLLVIGVSMPVAQAQEELGMDGNLAGKACTATAQAARTACGNGVRDDYWIAVGNCANIADAAARFDCLADAAGERQDGRDLCAEQYGARLDLCAAVGEAPYDPMLDPADFLTADDLLAAVAPNQYFPLVPGRKYRYEGSGEVNTVEISDQVVMIAGIPALAVFDKVSVDGEVTEDTIDWYAQDISGNVWYLGENSQEKEGGLPVSLEGSWTAGRDFAKPGIIMFANPVPGSVYRQEFSLGNAEDAAEVLRTDGSVSVPAASCDGDCVVTREFTPLEPEDVEQKFYAPGVGVILELDPATGERVNELVEITP